MIDSFVKDRLDELPLIAILRGLTPPEALDIGTALYESGIKVMEVTLNSPEPLKSIEILASHFEGKMAIGAGTVLNAEAVCDVHSAGGRLVVSPNVNVEVISKTVELGMHSIPGATTCSECFQAIDAGANGVKIFPASIVGISGLKDMMAVIPKEVDLFAVGGVTDKNIKDWLNLGIKGVGLGSNVYQAGDSPEETARKTKVMISLLNEC